MLKNNLKKTLLALVQSVAFGVVLCSCQDWSPHFGLLTLKSSQGTDVFIRREVSGPNHDLLIISANGDVCTVPDPQKDYVIDNGSDALFYRLEGETLHLYGTGSREIKGEFRLPVTLQYHEINITKWDQFRDTASEQGLKRLAVELDAKLKCN